MVDAVSINQTTYIQSQIACALIEALGMISLNMQRQSLGQAMAYEDVAFKSLIDKYGIHHNAVMEALRDS